MSSLSSEVRCSWCNNDPLYISYHDTEWGVALHDDRKLFEFLILESMQAGLSWITILKKREYFRSAFDNFNPDKIARYSSKKIHALLNNANIIRNEKKVISAIKNAKAFLNILSHYSSFNEYIWQFTDNNTIQNNWRSHQDIPATTHLSDHMAKQLKKDGFSFVGSTTCYAFMQAVGMVNDHIVDCFRHQACFKNK